MNACNCCAQPPCSAPSIECDSISSSKSKAVPCGFLHDGKHWLTKTTSWNYSFSDTGSIYSNIESSHVAKVESYDEYCNLSTVWSGSSSYTRIMGSSSWSCAATMNATGSWSGTATEHTGQFNQTRPISTSCCSQGTQSAPIYSNENVAETTSALIARTVAALPSYPSTWTGSCSSYRNLSDDESSYSIRKFKWRLKHAPSGTCYLKVWLRKKFEPEGGGDPTYTPLSPYTWEGAGNPCLKDSTKPVDDDANNITSDETEVSVPAENGRTSIEILKYSCVEGYEPDITDEENHQPSGFPDPAWTA